MYNKLYQKLANISPWHFIWMAVLCSEIFTFILNITLSPFFFEGISVDLLMIGAIDAFIVSMVVGSLIIYFINKIRHDRLANEQLRQEEYRVRVARLAQGALLHTFHGYSLCP